MKIDRNKSRIHRKRRVRKKIAGTSKRPRLCVFRSNRAIYAQLIDDGKAKILAHVDSRSSKKKSVTMKDAQKVGELMAKKISKLEIGQIVFDRGGYKYHGKIKALAEALRNAKIKF